MNRWRAGEDSESKGTARCTACTSASFPTMSYQKFQAGLIGMFRYRRKRK